jgi:nicotinamidase-related amidase
MNTPDYTAPDWVHSALVIIDMQLDFMDGGASPIPGTTEALEPMAEAASAFRSAGKPIVHVVRLYEPGGTDVDLPRRALVEGGAKIVAPGSSGSQIPAQLLEESTTLDTATLLDGHPQVLGDDEIVLFKPRWSAFHRTPLDAWLRARDVTTVVVAGCNLPNCPRASLFDASERDFRTVLVTDAVSQATDERLEDLRRIGVNPMTVAEIRDSLATSTERTSN